MSRRAHEMLGTDYWTYRCALPIAESGNRKLIATMDEGGSHFDRDRIRSLFREWRHEQRQRPWDRAERRLVSVLAELADKGWKPGQVAGWDDPANHLWKIARTGIQDRNLAFACVSYELLEAHRSDTVRGNMYLVVSSGFLPDTGPTSYGRIQRLLNDLRKKRVIPFPWVTDNIRSTIKPSSWTGLQDFADTVREAYRRDFWSELPDHVEIIVAKDTAAGRIAPVTRAYDVPLHPLRGYSSTSFTWSITQHWRQIDTPIYVYYVGDHDPSGRNLERSIRESLTEYSGRDFCWERLAVEPHQFDEFDVIPLAPKTRDTRYQKFVAEYGDKCAEVEAIAANDLRDMVQTAIESHIPTNQWERLQKIEDEERQTWASVMSKVSA